MTMKKEEEELKKMKRRVMTTILRLIKVSDREYPNKINYGILEKPIGLGGKRRRKLRSALW